jgi:hypothetical protein
MNISRAILTLWMFVATTPAWGQVGQPASADQPTDNSKGYFQAGLLVALHPEGTPYPRISPTVHGAVPGALIGGGIRLSPALALEVETVLRRSLVTPLVLLGFSSNRNFDGAVRDLVVGANLRLRPSRHLELHVGGGVAVSRYSGLAPPIQEVTRKQGTLSAGIAKSWRVGAKTAVVPMASYEWIDRPDELSSVATLGVSSHAFRIGVMLRH